MKIILVLLGGILWTKVLSSWIGEEATTGIFVFMAIYYRFKYFPDKIDPDNIPTLVPEVIEDVH